MNKSERNISIFIELFWGLICLAISGAFWGGVFIKIDEVLVKSQNGIFFTAMFLLAINLFHFIFGLFHVSENIGEVAPDESKGPFMHSSWEYDRILIRIIAYLTIGFSIYLRRAIEWTKIEIE